MAEICDKYFIESLASIGKKLNIPDDVAGATLMAAGSSAPEFFTAIIALFKIGAESVGVGTIVGSALFNLLVIIGASALVAKAILSWRIIIRDLGFYIISLLVLLFTFSDGTITQNEALLYVIVYGLYLWVLMNWKKWVPTNDAAFSSPEKSTEEPSSKNNWLWKQIKKIVLFILSCLLPNLQKHPNRYIITFLLSLVYIAALSWIMVDLGVFIARGLHVPEAIIALTILAVGTSVPDLLSSIVAARHGYKNMAVSNALGSNTFNILIGLGCPWLIWIIFSGKDFTVEKESLWSSSIFLFLSVILVLLVLLVNRFTIHKKTGYFFIILYLGYICYTVLKVTSPELFGIL